MLSTYKTSVEVDVDAARLGVVFGVQWRPHDEVIQLVVVHIHGTQDRAKVTAKLKIIDMYRIFILINCSLITSLFLAR